MPLFTGMRERSTHSCITAVKWDAYEVEIQQAMQDNAIWVHLTFIPVTGLKCSYGKIFSPLTKIPVGKTQISGFEPVHSLI